MIARLLPRLTVLFPVLAAACGLTLLLVDPLPLQTLRNACFDQYQRWHPRTYQALPVRIVDIDEESLTRLGQWPWPRTRLADLVDRLDASGVAAIGFDVVFAESDRTSPRALADLWSLEGDLRNALEARPDHDQVFARSIARAPVVVGFTLERAPENQAGRSPPDAASPPIMPARPFRHIVAGTPGDRWLHPFAVATRSLPILERAARGNGALSFVPDSDGVVRRVPLVLGLAGQTVATLSAELLRVGQGESNVILKAADENATGLAEVRIGGLTIPTNAHGELWVHYSAAVADRYLPAWKVLAGEVPPQLLDGHLVLVGSSAQGLMDLRFSPLGRIVPGVEVHAQALEQVLSGSFLQRPAWATAAEAIAIVTAAMLIGILALRTRALIAATVGALLLAAVLGGGWALFRHYGVLLDTVTPALTLMATFVLGSLIHHFVSERQQRWVKEAFSRYVSPNLVAYLVDNPQDMALGGRRQECSFVFTDLAGFTALIERTDPAKAVALLNGYLDEMIAIAFRHDGTLDRIVGDAVAIMFSAPLMQADHRARALACALEMDDFGRRYADELQARGVGFGRTRIGIHSGEVIVGNFGGSTIFDYRALGDPVNTAARLESANKTLGTTLCISAATLAGCPVNTPARPVGRLRLKGKVMALEVYEPLSPLGAAGYAAPDEYRAAYALLSRDDAGGSAEEPSPALARFQGLAERFPDDPLVALHLRRLRNGARGTLIVMNEK